MRDPSKYIRRRQWLKGEWMEAIILETMGGGAGESRWLVWEMDHKRSVQELYSNGTSGQRGVGEA